MKLKRQEKIMKQEKRNRIFLGGTCANSTWREELIPYLEKTKYSFFNPVVEEWTPECIEIENNEKDFHCGIHLYILTPQMKGIYSVAEIIDSMWRCFSGNLYGVWVGVLGSEDDWGKDMWKSLKATIKLIQDRKQECIDFEICDIKAEFLNNPQDLLK